MAIPLPGTLTAPALQTALAGVSATTSNPYRLSSKTVTFNSGAGTGAIGNVPLFTVSGGLVLVRYIAGRVTTNCVGTNGTLALGTTNKTSLFIAATAIAQLVTTTEIWISTTGVQGGVLTNAATSGAFIDENIVGTIATTAFSAGVIEFDCLWAPMTSGATVA